MTAPTMTTYNLDGRLLETCNCDVICPCWVGGDPDNSTCDSIIAWHIDQGEIEQVDVSNLTLALGVHIPGNVLKGNWRVVVYMDDKATAQQQEAVLKAFTGQLGGPLADLAQLIGEVTGMERASIDFKVVDGKGSITVGQVLFAEMTPLKGATGLPTTLQETIFSTNPGSPAYVSRASSFKSTSPVHGAGLEIQGKNAVQGNFHFEF